MNRKQLAEAITRLESKPYCKPADHIWVALAGGKGYDADYDTTVCILCHCYSSVRKPPKHEARPPSPLTQIGRK